MNNSDYIVKEVRKYRDEHAQKFNYDLHKICIDLQRVEKKSGRRLVKLSPAHTTAIRQVKADNNKGDVYKRIKVLFF